MSDEINPAMHALGYGQSLSRRVPEGEAPGEAGTSEQEAKSGLCVHCGAEVEAHFRFNRKLGLYEYDAGDLVPHDCQAARIRELESENARLTRELADWQHETALEGYLRAEVTTSRKWAKWWKASARFWSRRNTYWLAEVARLTRELAGMTELYEQVNRSAETQFQEAERLRRELARYREVVERMLADASLYGQDSYVLGPKRISELRALSSLPTPAGDKNAR